MDKESVINIIQFASIIIAGGLGIAGTVTNTKDADNKLTSWGKLTIFGILLANSFSFIETYLRQKRERAEQVEILQREKVNAIAENIKHKQTIALLNDNIRRSDSSLAEQRLIQQQSSDVLAQVKQGIDIQTKTFQQSKVLSGQQKEAIDDIERTLNPLLPFRIDVNAFITAGSGSLLTSFTALLKMHIDSAKSMTAFDPISKISNQAGAAYLINAHYENYSFFVERLRYLKILLHFSRIDKNGSLKTFKCEVPRDYMNDMRNFKDIQIIYLPGRNVYSFFLENVPVSVLSYAGVGFNSTKDLEDATLQFQIGQAPGPISNPALTFRFPPDFSRINDLPIAGKGNNVAEDFYYTYSVTTQCQLKGH